MVVGKGGGGASMAKCYPLAMPLNVKALTDINFKI